ncbi:MAG: CpaF family protein [bacterium]
MNSKNDDNSSRIRDRLNEYYGRSAEDSAAKSEEEENSGEVSAEDLDMNEFNPEEMQFDEEQLEELEKIQSQLDIIKRSGKVFSEDRSLPFKKDFIDKLKDLVPEIIETVISKYRFDKDEIRNKDEDNAFYNRIKSYTEEIVGNKSFHLTPKQKKFLVDLVVDEVLGYGPITELIHRDDISEIMVNNLHEVYVEKNGKIELTDVFFLNAEHVKNTIDKILQNTDRSIDFSSPSVDATLPDGSRVHAIIPPLTPEVGKITIRKFSKEKLQIDDLIEKGSLTPEMAYFLGACVKSSLNMVVAGGTSSGKTTVLNILSSLIPPDERIITIEDALELQFHDYQDNVIRLQTRDPNLEGVGEVTTTDLIRDSLRMRPDRIVVGEVRGKEFLDMLQAMNTGHDGSFTTVHANSPRETVFRLVNLAMLSPYEIPAQAIRRQIGSSIDLFVHVKRYRDGSRKMSNISEVIQDKEEGVILKDIFRYEQEGLDENKNVIGEHKLLRRPDGLVERFHQAGIEFPERVFEEVAE